DAAVALDQALAVRPDDLLYRPLALTLRGQLRSRGGSNRYEPAEQDFCDAIELSRRTSARSWELRATTSLARLLASQGRRDEARTMLVQIYNWFTEGFDTADLREAKALLEELSA